MPRTSHSLAERLRQLRAERGSARKLTQQTLAQALGGIAVTTISSYENGTVTPPVDRLHAYATFFASERSRSDAASGMPREEELTEAERAARDALYEELLALRPGASIDGSAPVPDALPGTWHFGDGAPVRLVCGQIPEDARSPLASPQDLNHTELLSYADLDALVELFGHIRSENPAADVRFRRSVDIEADDLTGHVVLLGGLGWNQATQWFNEGARLRVSQVEDPDFVDGEVFEVVDDGEVRRFYPKASTALGLVEDIGLLVRMPNPYNMARTLTICNGVYSRGVLGAVRCLTDAHLRHRNETYLAKRFPGAQQFGILMRVLVLNGTAVTPELNAAYTPLYEWSGGPDL